MILPSSASFVVGAVVSLAFELKGQSTVEKIYVGAVCALTHEILCWSDFATYNNHVTDKRRHHWQNRDEEPEMSDPVSWTSERSRRRQWGDTVRFSTTLGYEVTISFSNVCLRMDQNYFGEL